MRAELVEEASCMLEMAAVHMEASRATYAAPVKVGALPRVVGVRTPLRFHVPAELVGTFSRDWEQF